MKKTSKLRLQREAIRVLAAITLTEVRGGAEARSGVDPCPVPPPPPP